MNTMFTAIVVIQVLSALTVIALVLLQHGIKPHPVGLGPQQRPAQLDLARDVAAAGVGGTAHLGQVGPGNRGRANGQTGRRQPCRQRQATKEGKRLGHRKTGQQNLGTTVLLLHTPPGLTPRTLAKCTGIQVLPQC